MTKIDDSLGSSSKPQQAFDNNLFLFELEGNPDHAVHNASFCVEVADASCVMIICLDQSVMDTVRQRVSNTPGLRIDERVKLVKFSAVMKDNWAP